MKKDFFKKLLQLVLFLGLGIFFIWLSTHKLTPENIHTMKESARSIQNPRSIFFICLCIIFGAISHYIRAIRNILLIEPLGYKVRRSSAFYSVMTCYLANLAIPRLGEVLRCTFLQRYENVPFQKSLGTIVTERVIDVLCWLVIFVIAILINTSALSELVVDSSGDTLGVLLQNKISIITHNYLFYLIIVVFLLLCITIVLSKKWWSKNPFFVKIANFFKGIVQGIISVKNLEKPWLFALYTFLLWVFYYSGTYICFFAFGFLQHLGPLPALSVLAFSTIAYMVSQGGLGAYPLMVAGVLMLYGVDYSQGLAAGWIGWSAQTLMIIIFGVASLVLASFLNHKPKGCSNKKTIDNEVLE